jgi:hypothetical protein
MDKRDAKVHSDIKEFGWHVVLITADANGPAFAYSIGLQKTFKHPEVFIMGLKHETMHQIINGIGDRIKVGERFDAGKKYGEIISSFDCIFSEVPEEYFPAYFGTAIDFYKKPLFSLFRKYGFEVLQCIWPDKAGLFPSDPGFPDNLRPAQALMMWGHRMISKKPDQDSGHAHKFSKEEWPFEDSENTATLSTTKVMKEGFPVLLITHDEEGGWQILCDTTNDPKDALLVCQGCAFEKDRTIGELADLPFGWEARRKSKDSPWIRSPR